MNTPVAAYRYVDTAVGGENHRNHVQRVDAVHLNGQADCFASYQRATDELVTWLTTHTNKSGNPTVAGFNGPTWTHCCPLDFDHETAPEVALGWLRSVLLRLEALGVSLRSLRIYFSGHKGFHLEIPHTLFGGFEPSTVLHKRLKRAAELILRDIPFDSSIYDKLRLWRLENSRHGTSGLYKVRLTPHEALTLTIDEIRGLAARPRQPAGDLNLTPIPDDEWHPVDELVALWAETEQATVERERHAGAVTDEARDRQTIAAIEARWPHDKRADLASDERAQAGEVSRHTDYLLPIAGFLAGRTSDDGHIAHLLKAAARQAADADFLNGRDWESEIDRLAESSVEKRGTGEPITGLPTLGERFPALAAVLPALWPVPELRLGSGVGAGRETDGDSALAVPWPDPDEIWGPPPAPALPLEHLPREIADVTSDTAERLQCPPDFVAWPLLVSGAGLIGRDAGVRPLQFDDWTERACLWVTLIGPPSSLKSPAREAGIRPLQRQQQKDTEVFKEAHKRWEEGCAALKASAKKGEQPLDLPPAPVMERRITSDATVEKLADLMATSRGLTLDRDELAGFVADMSKYNKGGDRQFHLQAYTGGAYAVDRITRGTVWVPDLYENIVGGVQPDIAREIFGTGPEDGFAARFTSVWPDIPADWRPVDRWPNKAARDALDAVSDRLADQVWGAVLLVDEYKPRPYCRLDPEGRELFADWYAALMRDLRRGVYAGRHAARVGKYPGLAARLVLTCHLIEWAAARTENPRVVAGDTVGRVLDLIDDYILPMERRVYAAYGVTADAEGGRRIAKWIRETRPAQFTAREILRHDWSGLTSATEVAAALDWLVTRRWLREAQPESRPGRPSHVFIVNPRLAEGNRG